MNILITGATGFLGTNLVKKLVQNGHLIYVLARSEKKFEELIKKIEVQHRKQVIQIQGELTKKNLGLHEDFLQSLVGEIDTIYHTAAYLSFDEEKREDLLSINIDGTKHVLEVADTLKVKKFIHVSTAYTLGTRTIGTETLYPTDSTFINSYEESKCKAEHLVMSYQNSFDVTIMRPAIIIGDSETGEAGTTFGLYGILRAIELLKKKTVRKKADVASYRLLMDKYTLSNIVPVDYVVNVLYLGLIYGEKNTIYHITNPTPPSNEKVFNMIKEVYDFDLISLASYQEKATLTDEELKINQPLEVFKDYLNRTIVFEDGNTASLLRKVNQTTLNMDEAMLNRILTGYRDRKKVLDAVN
ncbi:SDR family NAD(P)-dependent oxidoreductase [Bacillus timonensis]|nr:SDR family NAD(P)-dependent oxidoreductase [Bacillus timonensis]